MDLFGGTISKLEKGISYSAIKQKTISQNISNADTPNYKASDVSFKDEFTNAISSMKANKSSIKHLDFSTSSGNPYELTERKGTYNHNGNNVDIDKEMAMLAQNQIYNQALVDRLNGKFRSLQTVIKGGK
ncbi:flagellar basal body rod protein FlgB [Priestia taiwanensis]|uniref:Flagellar basal body rod protein FlgB n=1 Tax=Priestia taiwanensis TaxID=1347902 RepID=A0A917APF7_9BACI|nr:flagellar basal body rod protein FlgB [Priestia taiwanensis]MBM7362847.1 flagellar basal-body rod protein FlgB [Priestia taiwanensis]GGE65606.1 flagellar basal body rod protein FlgB [Priestia taiwanensis]